MIDIRNVRRACSGGHTIEDLSLKLKNGGVYGVFDVCGWSGSVLLALMAGAILPDGGSVRMNGFDTVTDAESARLCVGYLPAGMTPYGELTPEEYLTFIADAKGLDYELTARTVQAALDGISLREKRRGLCRNLSAAEQRRLGIAQAELGEPEFILLDEPTQGLGERDEKELMMRFWALGEGQTVIINSRSRAQLLETCDEIVLLDGGSLVGVFEAGDPEGDAQYRALCERYGIASEQTDAMALRRRQRRSRRAADGTKESESRG